MDYSQAGSSRECIYIGCSDPFLVQMELGRVEKHILRRWHHDKFEEIEVRLKYQDAL